MTQAKDKMNHKVPHRFSGVCYEVGWVEACLQKLLALSQREKARESGRERERERDRDHTLW